jgi:cytoskeletal protein CcmA (bactofilin family)
MSALLKRDLQDDEVTDAAFDPSAYFDGWLADVRAANQEPSLELAAADPYHEQEIYLESRVGLNCELIFEGVLHFNGYSLGNVLSENGTLVLTRRGRIEADIEVGTAIIDGFVAGNITASERVVLESDAQVKGQIFTRALSMQLGALLDGDCLLTSEPHAQMREAIATESPLRFLAADAVCGELMVGLPDEAAEELEQFLLSA